MGRHGTYGNLFIFNSIFLMAKRNNEGTGISFSLLRFSNRTFHKN